MDFVQRLLIFSLNVLGKTYKGWCSKIYYRKSRIATGWEEPECRSVNVEGNRLSSSVISLDIPADILLYILSYFLLFFPLYFLLFTLLKTLLDTLGVILTNI